ncbi:MAG TPA: DUF4115 domain-containing protein, partial [Paenirhodobacter sp.]
DPEWAYARFCQEANFTPASALVPQASMAKSVPALIRKSSEPRDPITNPSVSFLPPRKRFNFHVQPGAVGSVLVLLMLIGGIGYGGWSVLQQVQKVRLAPVDQAPGVVADLDPIAGQFGTAPARPEGDASVTDPVDLANAATRSQADSLYRPQTLEAPVLVARDGPIAAIDPRSNGSLAQMSAQLSTSAGGSASGGAIDSAVAEALGAAAHPGVVQTVAAVQGVEIIAVRPSWVRIQAADGTTLFEKTLNAGERYVVPVMDNPPVLRAGNSGSVYFAVNGETYGPAAPGSQVVRGLKLSPEVLTTKYTLADVTGDADLARFTSMADAAAVTGVRPSRD